MVRYDRDEAQSPVYRTTVPPSGGSVTVYCRGPAQEVLLPLLALPWRRR